MSTPPFSFLLDLLFPLRCVSCGLPKQATINPSGYLCKPCGDSIKVHQWAFCALCNKKLIKLSPCSSHPTPIAALGVACSYNNQLVKNLIWEYKYRFVEPLSEPLAEKMSAYFKQVFLPLEDFPHNWITTFIPLFPARKRWRGFNQAELLAQHFSTKIKLPLSHILQRKKFKKPQVALETKKQRFENVQQAFQVQNADLIKNKNIILIDDICTSGATLLEAGKMLKRAGAKKIYGLVLARNM